MAGACPLCHGELVVRQVGRGPRERVERYKDCREICPRCGIGLTNAQGPSRTFIREDWKAGLWRPSSAARLETILRASLSVRSRPKKKARLANERSEDLLTWNVFSWLEHRGLLGRLLALLGGDGSGEVQVFYWGANDRYSLPGGLKLRQLLPKRFKEDPRSLSEPDLILVGPRDVVIIEAKLGSPNPHRSPGARGDKFDKYVTAMPEWFVDPGAVRKAGYYELTRNWAIGGAMGTELGRDFTLVNLVRDSDERKIVDRFSPVVTARGVFRRHTWEEIASLDPLLAPWLRRQTLHFQPAFPGLRDDGTIGPHN